ncbi:MAG TPA: MarP family serine protease [Acidimicrobiales bacterium]|nr:MarP family serine protease [Acidimicrobiales bacterium]
MNLLDVLLGVALVSAVVGGYRVGLVARVASWIGALGGFLLALRLLPDVLRRFEGIAPTTRLLVTLAALLGGAALGGAIGEAVGSALRRVVPPPARLLDRVGGGMVGIVGLVVALWLFLPVVAQVPGQAARLARNSAILRVIDDTLPTPPDASQAVQRLVGDARFPDVFDDLRPAPDMGPPPEQVPIDPAVVARAVASTVNVESEGCGGLHEGSGFVVAPDTVVTNAHVVAGGDRVRLRRPDGRLVRAVIVAFDDDRDLAVLRAEELGLQPLPIGEAAEGAPGAVLGYPGGQNTVRVAPAVIRDEQPTVGRDIYGRDRTRRQVLFLASALRPGDSGAALIDGEGRVVGVAFAIAPDRQGVSYAVDDSELRAVLDAPRSAGVGGPCV